MPERPRVAVVRVEDRAQPVLDRLRALGAEPILVPALRVAPPDDDAELREAAGRLSTYDAIVLGSVAAAQALVERASSSFDGPLYCVGARTRRRVDEDPRLASVLRGPRVVPSIARAEGLETALRSTLSPMRGKRILFPRPPEGRTYLIDRLEASGAIVDAPPAYRIAPAAPLGDDERARLADASAFLFFSGEAVRCFFEVASEAWARAALERAWVGVIGPAGAARAEALGIRVDGVPPEPGADALVDLWARSR